VPTLALNRATTEVMMNQSLLSDTIPGVSTPTLFDYQEPHVDALELALRKHRVALDASDLGTGKTVCACALARRLEKNLIVVCKKAMKPTWAWWMEQWGLSGVVGNWELARRRGLPSHAEWLYCFDEIHEAGGYKTLNAKLLVNTFNQRHPVLMLSATAIESPLRMWALGYLLGFHNLGDFYRWGFRNGVKRNYGYPGWHFDGKKEHLEGINRHIFPEFGSRMRKTEIKGFPECQFVLDLVLTDLEDKTLLKWVKMIEIRELEHEKRVEEGLNGPEGPQFNPGSDILPEILFARMRAELSKVPALIEEAGSAHREGYSVVIFVNFLPTLDALKTLGFPGAGLIYGGQNEAERATSIRLFQANKTRTLLSTIDSGGASIDLHDLTGNHPRMALVCPTWRGVTLRQALGRVHRAGGKSKSIQKLLYASGSIEEQIAARVRQKLSDIDAINDSDLSETEFV
jgi:superfamily II DNA or RNA helicase